MLRRRTLVVDGKFHGATRLDIDIGDTVIEKFKTTTSAPGTTGG